MNYREIELDLDERLEPTIELPIRISEKHPFTLYFREDEAPQEKILEIKSASFHGNGNLSHRFFLVLPIKFEDVMDGSGKFIDLSYSSLIARQTVCFVDGKNIRFYRNDNPKVSLLNPPSNDLEPDTSVNIALAHKIIKDNNINNLGNILEISPQINLNALRIGFTALMIPQVMDTLIRADTLDYRDLSKINTFLLEIAQVAAINGQFSPIFRFNGELYRSITDLKSKELKLSTMEILDAGKLILKNHLNFLTFLTTTATSLNRTVLANAEDFFTSKIIDEDRHPVPSPMVIELIRYFKNCNLELENYVKYYSDINHDFGLKLKELRSFLKEDYSTPLKPPPPKLKPKSSADGLRRLRKTGTR